MKNFSPGAIVVVGLKAEDDQQLRSRESIRSLLSNIWRFGDISQISRGRLSKDEVLDLLADLIYRSRKGVRRRKNALRGRHRPSNQAEANPLPGRNCIGLDWLSLEFAGRSLRQLNRADFLSWSWSAIQGGANRNILCFGNQNWPVKRAKEVCQWTDRCWSACF